MKSDILHNHSAKSYKGIYSLHKYWSKKPHNVVRDLIQKNTKKGELTLDCFCGSGISISEGLMIDRRMIGIDINPASIFITKQLLSQVNLNAVIDEFEKLKKVVKKSIDSHYEIIRNGKTYIGSHFVWNRDVLEEVWFQNGSRYPEKHIANSKDLQKARFYNYDSVREPFPKKKLLKNSRINVSENDWVHELFSPRNLNALAILYSAIEKIENEPVKDILKFCFTASLGQTSKMVFVINNEINRKTGKKIQKPSKSVGSWVIGYWRPQEHFEINVWNCFEQKFNRFKKARSNSAAFPVKQLSSFSEILNAENGFLLINNAAQSALRNLPDNSIDYVITDPPHGDRIPYLELSQLWNSWLDNEVNYEDEIIISGSNERNKDNFNYNKLLHDTFSEIHRVLKPERRFTLMFNSLDDKTWIDIVESLNMTGFKLKKLETLSYSSNSVVQDNRKAGLKTDFVLTYVKSSQKLKKIHLLNGVNGDALLKKEIESILKKKVNSEKYEILNQLFFRFLKKDSFFKLSRATRIMDLLSRELEQEKINPEF